MYSYVGELVHSHAEGALETVMILWCSPQLNHVERDVAVLIGFNNEDMSGFCSSAFGPGHICDRKVEQSMEKGKNERQYPAGP